MGQRHHPIEPDLLFEPGDDSINSLRKRQFFSPSPPWDIESRFFLHVGVDVNHEIIVELKGTFVILSP